MTTVTVVVQAECGFCQQAKDVLDRISEDFELHIETVDLQEEEGRRLAEASRLVFPPGVFLDGALFSYGRLSERKLRRHLRRSAEAR